MVLAGYHALAPTASASEQEIAGVEPVSETSEEAAPSEARSDADQHADLERLNAIRDEVQREVEEIRGFAAGRPVTIALRSREELRQRLVDLVEEDLGPREMLLTQRIVEMLGLLPPERDYLEMMLDLLEDQVAGYYDYRTQTFYLLESDSASADRTVIAHELMHALQDARWSLEELQDTPWTISDVALARSALVEGEATVLMGRYAAGDDSALQAVGLSAVNLAVGMAVTSMPQVPRFFVDTLVAPYIWGMRFASSLWIDGGWPAVDAAWERLPLSTEAIEWPERYQAEYDEPTFLTFRSARGEEPDDSDIIGVTNLRAMWVQLLMSVGEGERSASARARSAVDGWDGDRLDVWLERGDVPAQLLWLSVWDSVGDAEEAFAMFQEVASRAWCAALREPSIAPEGEMAPAEPLCIEGEHGERCALLGETRAVLVERWGDLVIVAMEYGEGIGDASFPRLMEHVNHAFATHERFGYPDALRSPTR